MKTMKEVSRKAYRKIGKAWNETYSTTDALEVYRAFSVDMRYKFLHKSAYIRRTTDKNNYDGTRTIVFYYDNDCKSVYIIPA